MFGQVRLGLVSLGKLGKFRGKYLIGQVRFCQVRFERKDSIQLKVRDIQRKILKTFGQVRFGQVRLVQFRLDQVRLGLKSKESILSKCLEIQRKIFNWLGLVRLGLKRKDSILLKVRKIQKKSLIGQVRFGQVRFEKEGQYFIKMS